MTRIRSALAHQLAGQQARAVLAQVQPVLQAHQIRALGHRRTFPRAGAGRRDRYLIDTARGERLAQERLGHRTAAGVTGADEEDVHVRT